MDRETRIRRTITRIGLLVLIAVTPMYRSKAQSANEFDVISIKPNHTGDGDYAIRTPPGGRFTGRNIPVRALALYAFDIKDFQLAGLPGWCDSERYDIEAKIDTPETIDPEGLRPLLRTLLSARFALTFHRETKELPIYSLSAAKGGPKLHANTGTPRHSIDWGNDHLNAMDASVAEFGRTLEAQLDRVVVDDTGITGLFDFRLTWTSDQRADTSGPSLFTAIQEQYGLKLESTKGPVGIIVVDHVDRPTEN